MMKTIWKWGTISGLIAAGSMAATVPFEHRIGDRLAYVLGYTTIVASMLVVYFGVRSYRETVGRGWMTFWRGFAVAISITAISCVFYVAAWEVIYFNFMPGFMQEYAEHQVEKARAAGASEAAIAAKKEEMKRMETMYRNPLYNIAITFIEPFPVGVVVSLVTAGVLRRRPPERQAAETGLAEA